MAQEFSANRLIKVDQPWRPLDIYKTTRLRWIGRVELELKRLKGLEPILLRIKPKELGAQANQLRIGNQLLSGPDLHKIRRLFEPNLSKRALRPLRPPLARTSSLTAHHPARATQIKAERDPGHVRPRAEQRWVIAI